MVKPSITVEGKKRGRPRGSLFVDPIPVRLTADQQLAIDTWRAAQPGNTSRSEAIRLGLSEWLHGHGLLAASPSGPEQEIRDQANRNARHRNDGEARSHAVAAAEAEMHGMDATADEKTSRRKALTDEPAVVTRAKAKHSKAKGVQG